VREEAPRPTPTPPPPAPTEKPTAKPPEAKPALPEDELSRILKILKERRRRA